MKRHFSIALAVASLLLPASSFGAQPLPARPEEMGFSSQRLERLHTGLKAYVDQGLHAGLISLVARQGRVVDFQTYGYRDLEARAPMERDTICRIFSMSKIVTSVAVLALYEEGKFGLDDPIERYIPELKGLKVCTGGTPGNLTLVDLKRPISIRHLLTHTGGFYYDFSAPEHLKPGFADADLWNTPSLKEFVTRLAKLPLAHQPGEAYTYGLNTDVLGYLVQVISGQPFETFLQERIFTPLGMVDTDFDVASAKLSRLAKVYEPGPDGKLVALTKPPFGSYAEKGRGFPSGGGGLFSTAGDYARFAQMLLNGGKLDGRQILGRKTVEMMTMNQLGFLPASAAPGPGADGFGFGVSVRREGSSAGLGSIGQFGWTGAATTYCNIDPKEKTVAIIFAQHLPYNQHGLFSKFSTLFYQSLVD